MSTKIKQLRVTHPNGQMNYVPMANKAALEQHNEILIQEGRKELCMLLEEAEMTQEEFDAQPPINPNFTPAAKASEVIAEKDDEIAALKKQLADLQSATKAPAANAAAKPVAKETATKAPAANAAANEAAK